MRRITKHLSRPCLQNNRMPIVLKSVSATDNIFHRKPLSVLKAQYHKTAPKIMQNCITANPYVPSFYSCCIFVCQESIARNFLLSDALL